MRIVAQELNIDKERARQTISLHMNSLYQNCAEELEQGTEIEKRKLC
jgi:hypothetical protein